MTPKVYILIVNWNTWKETITCLESVFRSTYENYQVVVIDNGSTNDSVARIRAWAEGRGAQGGPTAADGAQNGSLTVVQYDRAEAERGGTCKSTDNDLPGSMQRLVMIESGGNLGFAGGNNVGIRYSLALRADYVLLLNNDAFFRSSGTLSTLVDFMERTPAAGACGGRMLFPDGTPQQSYGNFPTAMRMLAALFPVYRLVPRGWLPGARRSYVVPDGTQREPVLIDWPSGACMLVRRSVIEEIGLLDEKYFLYLEETDWCYRMRERGWDRYYLPEAEIFHVFGGSVKTASIPMRRYNLDSQFIYLRKHFSRFAQAIVAAAYVVRASGAILFAVAETTIMSGRHPDLLDHQEYWRSAFRLGYSALRGLVFGSKRQGRDGTQLSERKTTEYL